VWFELAALLGGTVGELKKRMSHVEFQSWLAYRVKYGPLDVVRRYDRPAALMADMFARMNGKDYKGDLSNFLPWPVKSRALSEAEQFARDLMS
jgi:hypothetical protein